MCCDRGQRYCSIAQPTAVISRAPKADWIIATARDTRGHQASTDCKMIRNERIRHSNDAEIASGIVVEIGISLPDDMPGSSTLRMKGATAVNGAGRATPITPTPVARKSWTASVSAREEEQRFAVRAEV